MKNKRLLLKSALLVLLMNSISPQVFAGETHSIPSDSYVSMGTEKMKLPKINYLNDYGSFFEDFSSLQITPEEMAQNLHQFFNVDQNHSFKKIREYKDELGMSHLSFQHYYKDILVDGELVLLHAQNGFLTSVNGQFTSLSKVETSESVSNEQALTTAKAAFQTNDFTKVEEVQALIIKYVDPKTTEVSPKFVTKVRLSSLNPIKFHTYYIDQQTGEILIDRNEIQHADTPSTSATYYKANQAITVDS